MRIQGGIPVGGNLGVVAARPNPLLDPRFKIQGGEPWNKTPILPGKETKEYNEAPINIPAQFQLPGAMFPAGNAGGLMAQAMPGATALGGQMGMATQGQAPGMAGPNVFSVRPRVSYLEPEEGGLDLGGAVNIPIGAKGRINVQGGYQPETNMLNVQGTVGQPQGSPGLGVDFFVRRNLNRRNPMGMGMGMGMPDDMGGQLRYDTQF
jgi:hypothetical protein